MAKANRNPVAHPFQKIVGRTGYFLRECLNELRCAVLKIADGIADGLFKVMLWLDDKPAIAHYRQKDRGI